MFDHTPNMEWCKAQQQIVLSVDLVQAAKQQLRFLSTIDDIGCLYDGPAVERAIYRQAKLLPTHSIPLCYI